VQSLLYLARIARQQGEAALELTYLQRAIGLGREHHYTKHVRDASMALVNHYLDRNDRQAASLVLGGFSQTCPVRVSPIRAQMDADFYEKMLCEGRRTGLRRFSTQESLQVSDYWIPQIGCDAFLLECFAVGIVGFNRATASVISSLKKSAQICVLICETLTGQVCEKPFFSFSIHCRTTLPRQTPSTPVVSQYIPPPPTSLFHSKASFPIPRSIEVRSIEKSIDYFPAARGTWK
jgi:hypothetical protein